MKKAADGSPPASPPTSGTRACPFLARFKPPGRDHTYDVCEAAGEVPLVPCGDELRQLCLAEFERCPRHRDAAARRATSRAA